MVRLSPGARVAVIGAGPGGLVSAKHAIEAGFEVSVFEASDDLGGQWNTAAAHSGIWPGMRTNTSRAMTAFSDYPPPPSHDLHPLAEQVHDYLRSYSDAFGVTDRIRFDARVRDLQPGWQVDGEPFDAVIVASGRFRAPLLPAGLDGFAGEVLHAFDYPGADHFRDRRVLVYGNGVSGHEIASDIATVTPVFQRIANRATSCRRTSMEFRPTGSGTPTSARYGARPWRRPTTEQCCASGCCAWPAIPPTSARPSPARTSWSPVIRCARTTSPRSAPGRSRAVRRSCRRSDEHVTFADGSREHFDAIVCATGYRLDIPYLSADLWSLLGPDLRLHLRTMHPDLPGLRLRRAVRAAGSVPPAAGIAGALDRRRLVGCAPVPDDGSARASIASPPPAIDSHNVLAVAWPRRRESRRMCAPTPTSPSRCCSVPCCRRVTASTGRAPEPTRPRPFVTSWPPPRERRWNPTTLPHSPTSGSATCSR